MIIAFFLLVLMFHAPTASAQTMCADGKGYVDRPAAGFPITSNFGPRNCGGCSPNHPATDYQVPCGEQIAGPPEGCVNINGGNSTPDIGGYGYSAQFDCGNGIKIQYNHLSGPNSYSAAGNLITTGTSGSSTGCHLDYKIFADGKALDGQCAVGNVDQNYTYGNSSVHHNQACPYEGPVNLCDEGVQDGLKAHSDSILAGHNGGAPDGPTGGGGDHDDHDHDHSDIDEGPGVVVVQGTGGQDGTGGVSPEDDPTEEPQPDPEEDDPEAPDPVDPYDPVASTPRCDNSTCITQDLIDNAKHKRVKEDKAQSHMENLDSEGECKPPTPTGATVFRQQVGKIRKYPDAFCTNQGCVYENNSEGGDGTCK